MTWIKDSKLNKIEIRNFSSQEEELFDEIDLSIKKEREWRRRTRLKQQELEEDQEATSKKNLS
jgi:hypothetical protein